MNNENPAPSPEIATEPVEAEQAEEQQGGERESEDIIESEGNANTEETEGRDEEADKKMQNGKQQEEERNVESSKWDGFGDKEPEIRKYRKEYARDLGLGNGFGIEECKTKKDELNSGGDNNEEIEREALDNFREALRMDVSQADKESAVLMVGELELLAEKCRQEAEFAKINYLLKLEECLNAEEDNKKEKAEEFMSKDHPNRLEAIITLKIILEGLDEKLEELREKAAEEDTVITQEQQRSGETSQENSGRRVGDWRKKAWKGGKKVAKGLGWVGIVSAYGLSRILNWKKLDELMEKWTKKKLDPALKSGGKDSK